MAEPNSPHFLDVTLTRIYGESFLQANRLNFSLLSIREIPVGWNNKAVVLETESGMLLWRLSKATWPKEKIINECAALQHVKQHYTIPVPKVFKFGFATDAHPFHWILMEFIQGENLETAWRTLTRPEKLGLLDDLRKVITALQSKHYETIAGWQFTDSVPCHGLYFDGLYQYASETEYFLKRFHEQHLRLSNALGAEVDQQLKKIVELTPQIEKFIQNFPKAPIVLFHGDFAFRNMLISRDENGIPHLSALLDWEWCGTFPIFLDWVGDWLEEDTPETDVEENKWIRSQMLENGFPVWENLPGFVEKKAVYDLTDSMAAWKFEINQGKAIEGLKRIIDVVEKLLRQSTEKNGGQET